MLFEGYTGSGSDSTRRVSPSPSRGYGYGYPGGNGAASHLGVENKGFRPATPNRKSVPPYSIATGIRELMCNAKPRGQYSDAVLNELESQNDSQVEGIMGKVKILKEVRIDDLVTSPAFGLITVVFR